MKARPVPTTGPQATPIEELSVVRLVRPIEVTPIGYLPEDTLGTVVSVYGAGALYDVEFEEPVHALLTLPSNDIAAVPELTRARIVAAAGGLSDRPG